MRNTGKIKLMHEAVGRYLVCILSDNDTAYIEIQFLKSIDQTEDLLVITDAKVTALF